MKEKLLCRVLFNTTHHYVILKKICHPVQILRHKFWYFTRKENFPIFIKKNTKFIKAILMFCNKDSYCLVNKIHHIIEKF